MIRLMQIIQFLRQLQRDTAILLLLVAAAIMNVTIGFRSQTVGVFQLECVQIFLHHHKIGEINQSQVDHLLMAMTMAIIIIIIIIIGCHVDIGGDDSSIIISSRTFVRKQQRARKPSEPRLMLQNLHERGQFRHHCMHHVCVGHMLKKLHQLRTKRILIEHGGVMLAQRMICVLFRIVRLQSADAYPKITTGALPCFSQLALHFIRLTYGRKMSRANLEI
mmetsp:Transcript_54387/g.90082  ORF Transcript_54387/g.90082 Transcript_54387/m.90082 type:complete len:220 (-) Transcript_54387:313-972(-)